MPTAVGKISDRGCYSQLGVIWETPKGQVLRYVLAEPRQRAVLDEARRVLPEPDESVCPPGLALSSGLRCAYDLLRTVGRIGV